MLISREQRDGRLAPIVGLAAATIACLAPFAGKAFNIDDPLFLWAARQIHSHPFDFYGFTVNWYGYEAPASQIITNPPLASYYIALAAYAFGWGEAALHLAFLLPAVAAVAGSYLLARELCGRPLPAAFATLLTPAFLVSGTTVMCDTAMLALYVWAVLLWIRGLASGSVARLACASILVALCSLTKYFGISLIPLLLAYTLAAGRVKKRRALFLLVPVAILFLYHAGTHALYGRGLLLDAASYAAENRDVSSLTANFLVGLAFTGGCMASSFFFAPLLWRARYLVPAAILVMTCAVALPYLGAARLADDPTWRFGLQFALFAAAGTHVLFLAGYDLWKRRDAESLLLFLWVVGTFLFAVFVNWSINGRSVLPMAPAVAILVMRRLDERGAAAHPASPVLATFPLVPALAVALAVAWADYRLAGTARTAAAELSREYRRPPATLWFQGHWGFQYYMEGAGGRAFDLHRPWAYPGDFMVVPENNSNTRPEVFNMRLPIANRRYAAARYVATMDPGMSAAFYSHHRGSLPFAFGLASPETYYVQQVSGPSGR